MLCEMTSRRRVIASVAAAGLVPLLAPRATRAQQPYAEISYQSGGLRIQGYFYQPAGSGPFPTLFYNHGSRAGFERRPIPRVRLAGRYVAAGYAVLVPERRGYGRSDMYPPFTPTAQEAAVAPGHLLFSSEGLPIWGRDAIGFFDAYLRR